MLADGTLEEVSTLGEVDMASPTVLTTFLRNGIQNYPADHYGLILWGHGAGWRGFGGDFTPGKEEENWRGMHFGCPWHNVRVKTRFGVIWYGSVDCVIDAL